MTGISGVHGQNTVLIPFSHATGKCLFTHPCVATLDGSCSASNFPVIKGRLVNQSVYLYCHVSSKIYMHMKWGMVLRAFIITNRVRGRCKSRGGRPELPVRNSLYGLRGRKSTLNLSPWYLVFRSGMRVTWAVLDSPSLIVLVVSVDVKWHWTWTSTILSAQELCESRDGRPGRPTALIILMISVWRKATLNLNSWYPCLRSCVKVEVAVLGFPVPNSPYVLCGQKAALKKKTWHIRAQQRSEEGGGAGLFQSVGLSFASSSNSWPFGLCLCDCPAKLLKEQVAEYRSCCALAGSPPS